MDLRNDDHHHGGGFHRTTPLPPPQPPTHYILSSSSPSSFDAIIFRCRQHPNQSIDGPLHSQRLGIGTHINDDAYVPLTPRGAQLSGDGWRRSGLPRVSGLTEILFGGILGQGIEKLGKQTTQHNMFRGNSTT